MQFLKIITKNILKINFFWTIAKTYIFIIKPFNKLADLFQIYRNLARPIDAKFNSNLTTQDHEIISILGLPVVKNGSFKGLKYPSYTSFCSAIYPKIIGSYEDELSLTIEEFCNQNYSEIIDIGSADGYYAIGFALRQPNAKVYAYDIDEFANAFCNEMSILNNVSNNVNIESLCSADTLNNFKFTGKGLIISDCEGYEMQLFNATNIKNLINCDILIEIHDFIDANISAYLLDLFKDTHEITIIKSIDDTTKSRTYNFIETMNLNITLRRKIFAEGRPGLMEWIILRAK